MDLLAPAQKDAHAVLQEGDDEQEGAHLVRGRVRVRVRVGVRARARARVRVRVRVSRKGPTVERKSLRFFFVMVRSRKPCKLAS